MFKKTNYTVPRELLTHAMREGLAKNQNFTINEPTGNFFYDSWNLKSEYRGSVWDSIICCLPFTIGEARVLILSPATNYQIHADIDDRYHLNISGDHNYLIDFESGKMHLLNTDGCWYDMNAGKLHSAANFGKDIRVQLVVRKLLIKTFIKNTVYVKLYSDSLDLLSARFLFDNEISSWLNCVNKKKELANFKTFPGTSIVTFETTKENVGELALRIPADIKMEVYG